MAHDNLLFSNGDRIDLSAVPVQFVRLATTKQLVKLVRAADKASVDCPSIGAIRITKSDFLDTLADYSESDVFICTFDGLALTIYGHAMPADAGERLE